MNVDQSVSEPLTVIIIWELLCGVLKYKFINAYNDKVVPY